MPESRDADLLGLEGRSVIVIGAGGDGIGTAICGRLAAAGAHVIGVDREEEALGQFERAVERVGGEGTSVVADASDPEQAARFLEPGRTTGGPHGLVNVVGGLPIDRWQRLLDYTDENLDAILETNLRLAFRTSRAFARDCADRGAGGSIVHIASIVAFEAMPFGAGYAMAKSALLSLTRTMALEWGPLGIRANAVAPGTIRVPRNQASDDAERDRKVLPLGRRGTPDDIAGAVLFLQSDLATWITGQVLAVDGGASVKPSYVDETGLPVFVSDPALRARLLG